MFLDRLLEDHRARVIVSGAGIDRDATLLEVFGKKGQTTAGVNVDEDEAMGNSAFYCGVRALSWGVADLPFKVYETTDDDGNKTERKDVPQHRLLHDEPNPEMTSMKWREIGQCMRIFQGRALSYIQRDAMGQPIGLWPMHTRDVRLDRDANGARVYDVTRCKDEDEFPRPPFHRDTLFAFEVLDIPNLGGKSVIDRAREEMGETIAAQQLGSGFYSGGAQYAVAVKMPQGKKMTDDKARDNFRKNWERVHGGYRRRIAILDDGKELEPFGMSLRDAQFIDSRQWYVTQVARWLDVPPHMLKDLTRAILNNIYEQRLEWREALLPHCSAWNDEVTRKLFPAGSGLFAEHLLDQVLKANLQERYEAHRNGIQSSFVIINEARKRENWNSLGPAGDVILIPKNMYVVPTTNKAREFYEDLGLVGGEDEEPTQVVGFTGKGTQPADEKADTADTDETVAERARLALKDRIRHAISKESEEVRRAAGAKKNFVGWLDRFYSRYMAKMEQLIEPAAETCRFVGLEVSAEDIAFDHCNRSRQALLELAGKVTPAELASRVAREVGEWQRTLPDVILNELFKEPDNGED
jgi:HK97 family phage portal protein